MKWLLDTNVLSETRRPRPDLNVTTFLTAHPLADFYISSVTVAEIRFGIVTATDTVRKAQLEEARGISSFSTLSPFRSIAGKGAALADASLTVSCSLPSRT